ncbi:sugar phosphate isomerase/epimerase family protein [Planosporangium thailandense]|nr:sugar phosphate isomerase/epimerase [Planosporangium thailandense]
MTVPSLRLPELVETAVAHGIPAIAPWRDIVDDVGTAKAARIIRDAGLRVSSLCRGGMFTADDPSVRRAALDDNRRAIEQARELGAAALVLVCGPVVGRDLAGSREMVFDGISALVEDARAANVPLGIEPLHPMMIAGRSVITTLGEANDLAERVGDDVVGVVVDAYHVWWDAVIEHEVARAGKRILGFHVSDWVVPIMGELSSRGLMGDGHIDLPRLSASVTAAGYRGDVEVEIISDSLSRRDPHEVVRSVRERFVTHV